jgi:hypothetical protein
LADEQVPLECIVHLEKRETDIKGKKKLEVSLTLDDEEVRVEFTVDLKKNKETDIEGGKKGCDTHF